MNYPTNLTDTNNPSTTTGGVINIFSILFIRDRKSIMKFNYQKMKWTWTIKKWKIIHLPLTLYHSHAWMLSSWVVNANVLLCMPAVMDSRVWIIHSLLSVPAAMGNCECPVYSRLGKLAVMGNRECPVHCRGGTHRHSSRLLFWRRPAARCWASASLGPACGSGYTLGGRSWWTTEYCCHAHLYLH